MDSLAMRNPLYSVSRESYGGAAYRSVSGSEEAGVGIGDPGVEPEPSGKAVVGSYTLWRGRMVYSQARDTQLAKRPLKFGNVLAVVSDVKIGVGPTNVLPSLINYYTADLVEMSDYEPFGMLLSKRHWVSGEGYRFGFQAQESDDEWSGDGNMLAFKYWVHDARLGRWLSVDPLESKYPGFSPYVSMGDSPLEIVDSEGKDILIYDKNGKLGFIIVTSGEVRRYLIENSLFQFSGDPTICYPEKLMSTMTQAHPSDGKADAYGMAVDFDAAIIGGVNGGFEMITFKRGPYKDSYSFYGKFGGTLGLGGAGGLSVVAGWNSQISDEDLGPEDLTGITNSYWGAFGPASGSHFWTTTDGKPDICRWLFGDIAWTGYTVGIPPFGAGDGGGWSCTKYWLMGTIGGPEGASGDLRELDENYYQSIKELNKSVGILSIDETQITSAPPEECE